MEISQREASETHYWLDLIIESKIIKPELIDDLKKENSEIIAILTSAIRSAKSK